MEGKKQDHNNWRLQEHAPHNNWVLYRDPLVLSFFWPYICHAPLDQPQQNQFLCISISLQKSDKAHQRGTLSPSLSYTLKRNTSINYLSSYLSRILRITLILIHWIRFSRGHNVHWSFRSLLLISSLIEYDSKPFGWGRIVHIPLTEFRQWPTSILLNMEKKLLKSYMMSVMSWKQLFSVLLLQPHIMRLYIFIFVNKKQHFGKGIGCPTLWIRSYIELDYNMSIHERT